MVVDHDVDLRPDRPTQQADALGEGGDRLLLRQHRVGGPGARLDSGVAVGEVPLGVGHHLAGVIDADVRIEAHAMACRAAEEPIDRHAPRLTAKVPERLIHAGQGAIQDDAAAPEAVPEQALPVVLDGQRVLPDERLAQLAHAGRCMRVWC